MIDYQTFCQIHHLHQQKGLKAAQIAAELQLDPKTVQTWLDQPTFRPRQSPKRSSKLDAFKGHIVAMLERHPYSAQQIFQQLLTQGYAGGYTILKEFVRLTRPPRKPAFLMLEFAPGECAQVDWGQYGSVPVGSTRRRLSFFVMVLCHSRMLYVEFTLSETMEQFLSCHRHAFEFFGGVPQKVMIDNLKVGVVRHPTGQPALFNPHYADFAAHHGFVPVACNVRKGNEKGRVENGVGYIKKNFLNGLDIPSFQAINPAARNWMDTVANVRIHGETQQKPIQRFEQEKSLLRPLPGMPYDCAVIRQTPATRCCHVRFQANRYSVPYLYASQQLTLKIYPDQLLFFHAEKLIATHARSYDRRQNISNPDHTKELLIHRKQARAQTMLLAFLQLTPQAELYCRKLQEKRLNTPHHIQKIVALSEIYGPEKVARAIGDALVFDAIGCEYIANILQQRNPLADPPGALHLTHHQDLLDLEIPAPDLTAYEHPQTSHEKQTQPAP
jgi:transposase